MIRILVVSDLHVGSVWGLWPGDDFLLPDGRTTGLNPGQQYLLSCWRDFVRRAQAERPDILVLNGDLIDGTQYRSLGSEAVTTLVTAQKRALTELLEPLVTSVKELYVIQGTEYHDQRAGEAADDVARSLGAIGPHRGASSWEYLDLEVAGVLCSFAHHISVTTGLYRATALDREALWAAVAGAEGKAAAAKLVVRSHAHHYLHIEYPGRHAVLTPAWQLQTRFGRRTSLYRMIPDIGAVFLTVGGDDRDPIAVKKVIYPLPPIRPVTTRVRGHGKAKRKAV